MKINYTLILLMVSVVAFSQKKVPILTHENIEIKELKVLNSNYRETNLSISPDGKYLYFFSSRGGNSWSYKNYNTYKGKSQYDGDVWFSENKNGKWQKPKCLGRNVNTSTGEDEPNISPDGQSLVFQSWRYDAGRPYFVSKKIGNKWSKPESLGKNIARFFSEESWATATDGMSISPDGNTFIVACGADYDGYLNMFYSKKTNDEWSYPKLMNINTGKDERSVFIAGDGQTIFFASDGYGGYGGLDIFKATMDKNGKCSNILNIGKPFNTAQDDLGFIITASGEEAYFVRDDDIYYANLLDVDSRLVPKPTIIITGNIVDCDKQPIETQLNLINLENNEVAGSSKSDAQTGEYSIVIPENEGNYKIVGINENRTYKKFKISQYNSFQEFEFNLTAECGDGAKAGRKSN